jgi:hypothetical protein
MLEVSGHAAGPPGRSVMIWIQVRDVRAEHARLAAARVPIVREPAAQPWGLVEMGIQDPDGIRIVLVEVPTDHPLRRDPRPALPSGRRTLCRITARSSETRHPSARPVCGRRVRSVRGRCERSRRDRQCIKRADRHSVVVVDIMVAASVAAVSARATGPDLVTLGGYRSG